MYWNNVDPRMVRAQKRVLDHLGFDLRQDEATGVQHGAWMDAVLEELGPDDLVLFLDIDCFPLTSQAVTNAFETAERGVISGSAQTANHLPDRNLIYAAPSFLCFSAATWDRLGRVPMMRTRDDDVGMALTRAAKQSDAPVKLLFPSFVCCPKWSLADQGALGYGTFYGNEVFHLFQSRHNKAYEFAFHYVADCVVSGVPVDYVGLFNRMNSNRVAWEDVWRGLPRHTHRHLSNLRKTIFPRANDAAKF